MWRHPSALSSVHRSFVQPAIDGNNPMRAPVSPPSHQLIISAVLVIYLPSVVHQQIIATSLPDYLSDDRCNNALHSDSNRSPAHQQIGSFAHRWYIVALQFAETPSLQSSVQLAYWQVVLVYGGPLDTIPAGGSFPEQVPDTHGGTMFSFLASCSRCLFLPFHSPSSHHTLVLGIHIGKICCTMALNINCVFL